MKFWLAASFLLVFAAGTAVGFLAHREFEPTADSATVPLQRIYAEVPPYLIMGEEVYDELGLDAGQRKQIDDLVARHYKRVEELRLSLRDLALDLREGVLKPLTPAQQERLKKIQDEYNESEVRRHIEHLLMSLRDDLGLTAEQEPRVYQVLYDAGRKWREIFRSRSKDTDRAELRRKMKEVGEWRDARMKEALTPQQAARYEKRRSEERQRWTRGRREARPPGPPSQGGKGRRREGSRPGTRDRDAGKSSEEPRRPRAPRAQEAPEPIEGGSPAPAKTP